MVVARLAVAFVGARGAAEGRSATIRDPQSRFDAEQAATRRSDPNPRLLVAGLT
jgi:hypothetical protein